MKEHTISAIEMEVHLQRRRSASHFCWCGSDCQRSPIRALTFGRVLIRTRWERSSWCFDDAHGPWLPFFVQEPRKSGDTWRSFISDNIPLQTKYFWINSWIVSSVAVCFSPVNQGGRNLKSPIDGIGMRLPDQLYVEILLDALTVEFNTTQRTLHLKMTSSLTMLISTFVTMLSKNWSPEIQLSKKRVI